MQKVVFYLLPTDSFSDINPDSLVKLQELKDMIIGNSDTLIIPNSFWSSDDGKSIFDHLTDSERQYFFQLTRYCGFDEVDVYQIDTEDYHNRLIKIDTSDDKEPNGIIHNKEELFADYQKSAFCLPSFLELYAWKKKCYPKLLFTKDSFGNHHNAFHSVAKSQYEKLYHQTVQCLTVLNNSSDELKKLSEGDRIRRLQASLPKISCSGKGSGETQSFNKDVFIYKRNSRIEVKISCIPHFKLIRDDSDYRIYFSWGHDKIKEKAIIIVKLGSHWIDAEDSAISKIVIDK